MMIILVVWLKRQLISILVYFLSFIKIDKLVILTDLYI